MSSRVIRGGAWVFAGRLAVMALSLGFYAAAARRFPDRRDLAPLAALAILAEVFRLIASLGLPTAALRLVPGHLARGEAGRAATLLRASVARQAMPLAILAAATWFLRDGVGTALIRRPFRPLEAGLIVACAALTALYDALQIGLMARQWFGRHGMAHVLGLGGQRALGLALLFGFGVDGALAGFCAGVAAGAAVCAFWLRGDLFHRGASPPDGALLRYAAPYWLQGFARYVFHEGDQLLVALLLRTDALVMYFLAKRIAHGLRMMVDSATDVLRPRLGELDAAGADEAARGFARASGLLGYAAAPAALGIASLSGPLMRVYAGPAYAEAGPVLCALSLAMLAYAAFSLYEAALHMLARPVHRLAADGVCAAVMLVAFVPLVESLGGVGAAVAQGAAFAAAFAFARQLLRRVRPIAADRTALRRAGAAAAAMSFAAAATASAFSGPFSTLVAAAVGCAVYVAALGRQMDVQEARDLRAALPAGLSWAAALLVVFARGRRAEGREGG